MRRYVALDRSASILSTDIWFSQLPAGLAEAVDGLYAMLTGALTISGVTREGREAVLSLVEPPSGFWGIS